MYRNVIFPIDLEDTDSYEPILQQVIDVVRSFGKDTKLHLMNVVPDYGLRNMQEFLPKGWIENLVQKSESKLLDIAKQYFPDDIKINIVVGRGIVYQSILDTADAARADLIIVPAHSRTSSEFLLGPNAAKVARHAKISVLVVRE